MPTNRWIGGATDVAQADSFAITGAGGGSETWTFTITDENGGTNTDVTFTDDGTPTTAEIVAGLVAAWNANTYAKSLATASGTDTPLALAATTAGKPIYVTLTASGTGTVTKTTTTSSKGAKDWNTPTNWSLGRIPAANDFIEIGPNPNGNSYDILYGLDSDGYEIDQFKRLSSYTGNIGSAAFSLLLDVQDGNIVEWAGATGTGYISFGAAAISPRVKSTQLMTTGQAALYLGGSALVDLYIDGAAHVALKDATLTGDIVQSGAQSVFYAPSGNTLTGVDLNKTNGIAHIGVACGTITNAAGTVTTSGSGAVTTINCSGGTVYSNSTGTVTTANATDNGTIDFTASKDARTVTNTTRTGKGVILTDTAYITHTNSVTGGKHKIGPV